MAMAFVMAVTAAGEAMANGETLIQVRPGPGAITLVLHGLGSQVRGQAHLGNGGVWHISLTGLEQPIKNQQIQLQQVPLALVHLMGDPQQDGQAQLTVEATPGHTLPRPELINIGDQLMVQFPGTALQQQAVAPPVGSMAVDTIVLPSPALIPLHSPEPVTMRARDARAQDVLMGLMEGSGYHFIFLEHQEESATEPRVTVDFHNESLEKAVGFVLLSSGLEGYLEDRTLVVGPKLLTQKLQPRLSKVIRLNQVDAAGAAGFLANLGATMSVTHSVTTTATESSTTDLSSSFVTAAVSQFGGHPGPLQGLYGTTDERLNTITVVGSAHLVHVAEDYLQQMDRRKRQVAVKVQVMNVDLNKDELWDNSFSARIGDIFIVSESGRALLNFGTYKPAGSSGTGIYNGTGLPETGSYILGGEDGSSSQQRFHYPDSSFYYHLQAAITSSEVNLLAEPTLLVQEGESASINTTTSVITGNTTTTTPSGITQTSQEREEAGLSLMVDVSKIDDNGFISLKVNPKVSVPVPAGIQNGVPIFNVTERALSSGSVRLRDGQTLILTGVIQDSEREQVTRWPILGDLPLLGQLFRGSSKTREKTELIILVTPTLIEDGQPLALQSS